MNTLLGLAEVYEVTCLCRILSALERLVIAIHRSISFLSDLYSNICYYLKINRRSGQDSILCSVVFNNTHSLSDFNALEIIYICCCNINILNYICICKIMGINYTIDTLKVHSLHQAYEFCNHQDTNVGWVSACQSKSLPILLFNRIGS